MLNNIVGLKPSLGLISTIGVVPACRTLDCVSIFALTVDDAMTALAAIAGPDAADPYSRNRPLAQMTALPHQLRLGVPRDGQLIFFGDQASERAYAACAKALDRARLPPWSRFDLEPFYETARLLYEGPWVAERYLVIARSAGVVTGGDSSGDARDHRSRARGFPPPTPLPLSIGCRRCAQRRRTRLRDYRRAGAADGADRLHHRAGAGRSGRAQLPARHLHQFRQFARSLRPGAAGVDPTRRTCRSASRCLAPAGQDAQLAAIGRVFHADTQLPLGARSLPQPPLAKLAAGLSADEIAIAVVGAHLSGMALNGELKALGGRLLEAAATAPDYRLYALATTPPKPGMLRVAAGTGTPIAVELWALSAASFRKIRRRDPAAAVDRHRPPCRWPRRQRFHRRTRRCRRRARHFRLRRLARVHGGEDGGVAPYGEEGALPAASLRHRATLSNHEYAAILRDASW